MTPLESKLLALVAEWRTQETRPSPSILGDIQFSIYGARKACAAALEALLAERQEPRASRQLTYAEKSEVSDILLNMIGYKHGPASAREWVEGVVSAIAVWRKAKLDDPNYYCDDPKCEHNIAAAEPSSGTGESK